MFHRALAFALCCSLWLGVYLFPLSVFAASSPSHVTLIVNQVRGLECCDAGTIDHLQQQETALQRNHLVATFAVRYDAIKDPAFVAQLKKLQSANNELGAFLEVTPSLAAAAHVSYPGNISRWYEAQQAYLIGYAPNDRKKLIDAYMGAFHTAFGTYPSMSLAWMIDPVSLSYLQSKYGIKIHEITREQWGTDTYTLYGGPPQEPYRPSANWALIPDATSTQPLIIRQTITDAVDGYGDQTSGYTSQPNDYMHRGADISYFSFLLNEAHAQPTEPVTTAVLGLENSMDTKYQNEFGKQMDVVGQWLAGSINGDRAVMTATNYAAWWQTQQEPEVTVYSGTAQTDAQSAAWWITTPHYRARIREDHGTVYLDDLRVYDTNFTDPYLSRSAARAGYWDVPFLIDGSRFTQDDVSTDAIGANRDNLTGRKANLNAPTRIELGTNVGVAAASRNGNCVNLRAGSNLATFCPDHFALPATAKTFLGNGTISPVIQVGPTHIVWQTQSHQNFIGVNIHAGTIASMKTYTPFSDASKLDSEREDRFNILFPILLHDSLSPTLTTVQIQNNYVIAGTVPDRLLLFPVDANMNPVRLSQPPTAQAKNPDVKVKVGNQLSTNGTVQIDFSSNTPTSSQVSIDSGEFSFKTTVYFAPDCKRQFLSCLEHPVELWWYLRTLLDDAIRHLRNM